MYTFSNKIPEPKTESYFFSFMAICSAALINGYAAGEAVKQGCVPICIVKNELTDILF